jgi:hypothetical protein
MVYRRDALKLGGALIERLCSVEGGGFEFNSRHTSLSIEVASAKASDFAYDAQGIEAFSAARTSAFTKAAEWLCQVPASDFAGLQRSGHVTEMWLFLQISQDQCEFDADARFLQACAERGLTFRMISNE